MIEKHIDSLDYYSLLSGGAPLDEFDNESRKIAMQISDNNTTEEIANIIAEVFQSSFGNVEKSADYLKVANQIRQELYEK